MQTVSLQAAFSSSSWAMRFLASRTYLHLQVCQRCLYSSAAETSPSPIMSRIRNDLKSAMRNRDAARLSVLRGVLADITNSSKTSSPIRDDLALLSLLRKRISASKSASEEFSQANRKDLVDKEDSQIAVLEEYAGGVDTVAEDEIRVTISQIVKSIQTDGKKLALGDVMKRAIGPGGVLEGRPVEKPVVARVVKEVIAESVHHNGI